MKLVGVTIAGNSANRAAGCGRWVAARMWPSSPTTRRRLALTALRPVSGPTQPSPAAQPDRRARTARCA
jgi:hypothetical protein